LAPIERFFRRWGLIDWSAKFTYGAASSKQNAVTIQGRLEA
jgi:hypothetical protein